MVKKIINENSEIVLIENYSCESRKELLMREQYWINYYRNETEYNVVNQVNSYLTEEEYIKQQKDIRRQYGLNNKDKIKEMNRRYRENNKEKVKEINRRYRENNRDKLNSEEMKEYQKQYQKNNRDKININKREYKDRDKEKWREYNKLYQKELYYMKKFGNVMSEFLEMLECY